MFKNQIIICALAVMFFCLPKEGSCHPLTSIMGKVVHIDHEAGIIDLETESGVQMFYLSPTATLFMFGHHMSIVEVVPGDPVAIQYEKDSSGKKLIIKLVDHRKPI